MKTKFLTLFFLACVCLWGGCTGVDFVIPEPVQKEEGNKNEQPEEPTPEPEPDQPTPDPEPMPDPDPTPEPEPEPDPDVPTFSNRVKWVASKADLEGLSIVAGDTTFTWAGHKWKVTNVTYQGNFADKKKYSVSFERWTNFPAQS